MVDQYTVKEQTKKDLLKGFFSIQRKKTLRTLVLRWERKRQKYNYRIKIGAFQPLGIGFFTDSEEIYRIITRLLYPFGVNKVNKEIVFYISLTSDKEKKILNKFSPYSEILIDKRVFIHKNFLYTKMDSFFFLDTIENRAYGFVDCADLPFLTECISKFLYLILCVKNSVFLHSACLINNQYEAVLFPGESGCGKSTVTHNLMSAQLGFREVNDDNCCIYRASSRVWVSSHRRNCNDKLFQTVSRYPVSCSPRWIIFPLIDIYRDNSEIIPISNSEAFERLIPLADMVTDMCSIEVDKRLSLLKELTIQCNAYLLKMNKSLKNSCGRTGEILKNVFEK